MCILCFKNIYIYIYNPLLLHAEGNFLTLSCCDTLIQELQVCGLNLVAFGLAQSLIASGLGGSLTSPNQDSITQMILPECIDATGSCAAQCLTSENVMQPKHNARTSLPNLMTTVPSS